MGLYHHLQKFWGTPEQKALYKERMIKWRREEVATKVEHPTRLDRAHALGYKAKKGFIVVRFRIGKGSSKREKPAGGRKPTKSGMYAMHPGQNLQSIAEMRCAKKHPNMQVLGSYYVSEDGRSKWYEIILVDPQSPDIKNDQKMKWLLSPANKGRVFRGLTAAGKRHRA
ncbi:MAG TPA: 50S ribosomal protein L15e [archaeon]|nr:50S ribosomal protein L15e [archaeon]